MLFDEMLETGRVIGEGEQIQIQMGVRRCMLTVLLSC
jgi:hypothetical protein